MLLPAGHTYSSYMGAFLEEYLVLKVRTYYKCIYFSFLFLYVKNIYEGH